MSSYHSSHFLSAQVQQQKKRTFPQNCCHPFALFRVLDSNRQSPYKIFTWHCSTFLMCSQKCLAEKKKKIIKEKNTKKKFIKKSHSFFYSTFTKNYATLLHHRQCKQVSTLQFTYIELSGISDCFSDNDEFNFQILVFLLTFKEFSKKNMVKLMFNFPFGFLHYGT